MPTILTTALSLVLQLSVPPSAGNFSFVRNDTAYIRSAANVSGWLLAPKQSLRNKRLRVQIVKSSWDNSMSIAPRVDSFSTNGMYTQATRLRFCPYGLPRTLHAEWRKNGVQSDLNLGTTGGDPFWMAMAFVNDSVRFERSQDGEHWQVLWREKFDLPGYTLADSFYIELQAHKTPSGGELIATHLALENLMEPQPPPAPIPVQVRGTEVTVEWDANTDADLAGYRLYYGEHTRQYDRIVEAQKYLAVTVKSLKPRTQYFFAATSYDHSGNESAYSAEVSALTGEAEPQFSEYDLNLTGAVDVFDWLLLLRLLGYETGHALFSPRADLTKDGRIDGFDKARFALLAKIW